MEGSFNSELDIWIVPAKFVHLLGKLLIRDLNGDSA